MRMQRTTALAVEILRECGPGVLLNSLKIQSFAASKPYRVHGLEVKSDIVDSVVDIEIRGVSKPI